MAYLQMNLYSQSLMRTVPVNVILPVENQYVPGTAKGQEVCFKTLYLLHGVMGNHMDWVNGTRIQRFATEKNLAVVMPAGENAFYVDHKESYKRYGEFVGEELVELTRRMFPLSRKREDTFIGGLSMGGYGAMRNGLKYHETFGCIVSLSGAFLIDEMPEYGEDAPMFFRRASFVKDCFGDLTALQESDKNPKYLIRKLKEAGAEIPRIYMACGEQDELLVHNQDFADFLKKQGVNFVFEAGPGNHEWDFWDTYIKKAIDWLPTEPCEHAV